MSSMFLTHEEVCDLTGARTKARQIGALKRNGIRRAIKRSRWPSVTTAAIIQTQPAAQDQPGWRPQKTG